MMWLSKRDGGRHLHKTYHVLRASSHEIIIVIMILVFSSKYIDISLQVLGGAFGGEALVI